MTLLVRDEEDILASNIEYHLARGVDFILATNNLSLDSTEQILDFYRKKGVLDYNNETTDDYSQSKWVTVMARRAFHEFDADWVINNDADEFWWPEVDGSLKDVLRNVPVNESVVSASRFNFHFNPASKRPFFIDNQTVRWNVPSRSKVCHRGISDIEIGQGNHHVYLYGEKLNASNAPITIFHFPIRSYQQYERKIVNGGRALFNNISINPKFGQHWKKDYHLYLEGRLRENFDKKILTDEKIEDGIVEGIFVRDFRIKQFFDEKIGLPFGK